MSKALRSPTVLKVLLASRQPGADKLGQALQVMQTSAAQALQELSRADEGPRNIPPEVKQIASQAMTQAAPIAQTVQQAATQAMTQVPQVAPAAAGTAGQVSPILVPNPTTRATFGTNP